MISIEYIIAIIVIGIILFLIFSKGGDIISPKMESFATDCGVNYKVVKTNNSEEDKEAAIVLCRVNKNCKKFINYLKFKYGAYDPRVKKLVKEYDDTDLVENKKETFILDKGEKIHLCLRNGKGIYDINILMFVTLHELAHIITDSIGHDNEFWKNNVWLMREATLAGVFNNIDYKKYPQEYCGLQINNNPSFDNQFLKDMGNINLQKEIQDKKLQVS